VCFYFDQILAENASCSSLTCARPADDLQHVGKYRFIKTIGRGNFAKVKLAKHVPTSRQVKNCISLFLSFFIICVMILYSHHCYI